MIKFGGSLLSWSQSTIQLRKWLELQPDANNVLIAGGGQLVDVIRQWDKDLSLGHESSHQLALTAMKTTSLLLHCRLPEYEFANRLEELTGGKQAITIFDCSCWTERQSALPRTWEFTSDSIAAAVAKSLGAIELVLLKSRLPDSADLTDGIVDPMFMNVIATRPTRVVNLRSIDFDELVLTR